MSSNQRKREKQLEHEKNYEAQVVEERRRRARTFWEVIEEDVRDYNLKTILHALAEKAGLE